MQFDFGKYKDKNVEDVLKVDMNYCKWASTQPYVDDEIKQFILGNLTEEDLTTYRMKWGKYKNKSISEIKELCPFYIKWLKNNDFAKKDLKLMEACEELSDV